MKRLTSALALFAGLICCFAAGAGEPPKDTAVRDGFYLIVSEHEKRSDATVDDSQHVVSYRRSYEEDLENRTTSYLVLDREPFIPIQIDGEAQLIEGGERPILQLTLVETTRQALEAFTRKNLGRDVAIVVGDSVVSTHTIKEVITGGQIQVSRCEDDACRYIKARLDEQEQKNVQATSDTTNAASQ